MKRPANTITKDMIRGPRGAVKHDRAEAAMLGLFGARQLWKGAMAGEDWRLAFKKDMGA